MSMKQLLYLNDAYMKEFDAVVTNIVSDDTGTWIVLDQSAFYPQGGGQPFDTGTIVHEHETYAVSEVRKGESGALHRIDRQGLKVGDRVHGIIDWDRRYRLMRTHTAAHIVSGIAHQQYGAQISGNQLDIDKARVDFSLESFDRDLLLGLQQKANEIIKQNHVISAKVLPREEAIKIPALVKLEKGLDPSIMQVRILSIGDFDMSEISQKGSDALIQAISEHAQKYASQGIAAFFDAQADGGTHVQSTSEIKGIEIIDLENKGKGRKRIYFRLVD